MPQPRLRYVTLDVFTHTQYTGNPVAIVKVPRTTPLTQTQKQRIAREFNLSETVFLHEQTPQDAASSAMRMDIFTPYVEHPFAGHPTVGTANYVLRMGGGPAIKALLLKAGRFEVQQRSEAGGGVRISLAHNVHLHSSPFAEKAPFPVFSIVKGMTFILARQSSLAQLASRTKNLLGPEGTFTAKSALDEGWRVGIVGSYFFAEQGHETDGQGERVRVLRTRMMSAREDPGTGSAASALSCYLSLVEKREGRYRYHIVQGVEMGQRNDIFVEVGVKKGSGLGGELEIEEVQLSGSAVLNFEGTIAVPDEKLAKL